MLLVALSAAWADDTAVDCPAIGTLVASAWASYDDAELEAAAATLHRGREVLGCQTEVVSTAALLEMFRLDGLVALSRADREDAVYAAIRAVTIDPDSAPPETYGPELAELTSTWVARLSKSGSIKATGVEQAWVDGRPLKGSDPLAIVPGEHVVQWRDPDGLHSEIVDVKQSWEIKGTSTGTPVGPNGPDGPEGPDGPDGPRDPKTGGKHGVTYIATGLALAAGGGGTLAWTSSQEKAFRTNPWDADQYGDCAVGDSCYDYAREEAIRGAAGRIRTQYLAAYALLGVGVVTAGTGVFLVSDSAGIPSGVGLSVRW